MTEDLREAYWTGYSAYQAGVSRYDNPYEDDRLYNEWASGWDDAAWDD